MDCLEGYNKRIEHFIHINDSLNHGLGQYISYAFNAPKHYPKEPFLAHESKKYETFATTDDERIRIAKLKYGKKL